jgi:hypothetical protein
MGRWMSPDWSDSPESVPYAVLADPQTLNLYGYVRNNPVGHADADGHEQINAEAIVDGSEASARFLGAEIVGAGKGLYNAFAGTYNLGAELLNEQQASSGQPRIELPLAPTASYNNLGELVGASVATLGLAIAGGAKTSGEGAAAEASLTEPHPSVTTPYERPTGATTAEQRAAVQGNPCVDCGSTDAKMVANHKTPLVKEYYQTGTIDKVNMRSVDAVNSHCATCSNRSGAELSRYSRRMKAKLGNKDGD